MSNISEALHNYCTTHHIVYSERRRKVVESLIEADGFVEAESVWMDLKVRKKFSISLGSVYLILNWLVNIGFVEKHENTSKSGLFRINLIKLQPDT